MRRARMALKVGHKREHVLTVEASHLSVGMHDVCVPSLVTGIAGHSDERYRNRPICISVLLAALVRITFALRFKRLDEVQSSNEVASSRIVTKQGRCVLPRSS